MTSLPEIIAHRGVRQELPENTVASIEGALLLDQLSGVEFDVELADFPCVLHQETMVPDPSFQKLVPATRDFTARDWVSDKKLSDLLKVDAGSWLAPEFSDVTIPSLEQVLSCDWKNKTPFMELKDPRYWTDPDTDFPQKIVQSVLPLVQGFKGELQIISFSQHILREALYAMPARPRLFALWFEWQDKMNDAIDVALEVKATALNIADKMLLENEEWLSLAHKHGLKLYVYPVSPALDEPEWKNWTAQSREKTWRKLLALNVDGIITDFPRELLSFIK